MSIYIYIYNRHLYAYEENSYGLKFVFFLESRNYHGVNALILCALLLYAYTKSIEHLRRRSFFVNFLLILMVKSKL